MGRSQRDNPGMVNSRVYDLCIIGGGPTGLFGLFYACIREMDTVLIDSLPELGGQLTALYPEKDVYDMPGFPRVRARDLATDLARQATMHRPQDILLGEKVETLRRDDDANHIELVTASGKTIHAKTVVITTGAGAFRPNKLKLPVLDALEEKNVYYFVRDKSVFAGRRIVIVGGGDSALDWVLSLAPVTKELHLVHRRDGFRAHEDTVSKVMALPNIQKHLFYEVHDVKLGADGALEEVILEDNRTHETLSLQSDALLLNLGFAADMGPVKQWGLELKANSILVNSRMETNIPGVYAAGDVATYPGKLKLIATGVGEAAIAVNAAKHHIDPTQREQPVHSTTLFEKKKPPEVPA